MTAADVLLILGIFCAILAIGGWWADRYDEHRDARRRNR